MAEQFSAEWAKGVIDSGVQKAQGLMDDPEQMDQLLQDLQAKLKGLPDTVATAFTNVPLMAQMVKCYVTREYTEVSPKVIVSLVSAFAYLVAQKDLIPDNTPVIGFVDDIAVATIAMAINEPELKAFELWREQNGAQGSGASLLEAPVEIQPEEPVAQDDANEPGVQPADDPIAVESGLTE